MVKKVRQVLKRKIETVTSTFATRMLSIEQFVIQILPDIIIRKQQLGYVWYCHREKIELTVNYMKNFSILLFIIL